MNFMRLVRTEPPCRATSGPGGCSQSLNQALSQAYGGHTSPRLNMRSRISSALGSLQQRQSPTGRRRLWPIMTPLLGLRRPPGRV